MSAPAMKNSRPLLLSRPVVAICLTIAFCLAAGTAVLSVFSIREVAASSSRFYDAHGLLRSDDLRRVEEMIESRLASPELFPGSDRAAMEELRRFLSAAKTRESDSLAASIAEIGKRSRLLQLGSFAMLGVAIIMCAVGFVLYIRRMHELETIITVCAWTKRVKYQGRWVNFEDYLHDRFHLELSHSISEDASKKLLLEELELNPGRISAKPRAADGDGASAPIPPAAASPRPPVSHA